MGLKAEERRGVVLAESSPRRPQLTEIAPQPLEKNALVCREATGASEQVTLTSEPQQLSYPSFERCDAVIEQALCQSRFRATQLRLSGPLLGTRQTEECATRLRETACIRSTRAKRPATQ